MPTSHFDFCQAISKGDIAQVCNMLNERVDVNAKSLDGERPLHLAVLSPAICRLLITNGARVDERSEDGDTALHRASGWGNTETIRILLDAGADLNAEEDDKYGLKYTAVHNAARRGRTETLKLLIKAGASINIREQQVRHSLLVSACEERHFETIQYLLSIGANPNQHSQTLGGEPLRIPLTKCPSEADAFRVIALLLAKGAAPDRTCMAHAVKINAHDSFYAMLTAR